nr:hypothetical protein [uncultured Halomonas sp.]
MLETPGFVKLKSSVVQKNTFILLKKHEKPNAIWYCFFNYLVAMRTVFKKHWLFLTIKSQADTTKKPILGSIGFLKFGSGDRI